MILQEMVPKPGQTPSIGNGEVIFKSPNLTVKKGDQCSFVLLGMAPNVVGVGHMSPWGQLTYDGATDANGNLTIDETCAADNAASADKSWSITDGTGLVLAIGVHPGGVWNPAGGFYPCQYGLPGPAPTVLPKGLAYTEALVTASWTTKQPVASIADLEVLSFQAIAGGLRYTFYLNSMQCLNDAASKVIADALGGNVFQAPCPNLNPPPPNAIETTIPDINWIEAPLGPGGSMVNAVAADVMWAFGAVDVSENAAGQATLGAAILKAFGIVAAPTGGAQ